MKHLTALALILITASLSFAKESTAICHSISQDSYQQTIKIKMKSDSSLELNFDDQSGNSNQAILKLKQALRTGNIYAAGQNGEATVFVDSKLKALTISFIDGTSYSDVNVLICK